MKKSLPFLLLMLFALSHSYAQHRQKFGINAGLNYSKFRNMDVQGVDYNYASGSVVGISYEYYFDKNFSIKANMCYDTKRSRGSVEIFKQELDDLDDPAFGSGDITFKFTYHYLTLPVLFKYEFNNAYGFFINGGPFLGYLLDSEFVGKANNGAQSQSYTEDTTYYNNKFDFGITSGVGKVFQINNKNSVTVEFRNNLGLAQTNKNNTFDNNKVRSNSYSLLVGWGFDM